MGSRVGGRRSKCLSPFSRIIPFELLKEKKKKKQRTLPDNTEGIFPRDRPKADSHLKTCPKWSCPSEQIPQACGAALAAAARHWRSAARFARAQPIAAPLRPVASRAGCRAAARGFLRRWRGCSGARPALWA